MAWYDRFTRKAEIEELKRQKHELSATLTSARIEMSHLSGGKFVWKIPTTAEDLTTREAMIIAIAIIRGANGHRLF